MTISAMRMELADTDTAFPMLSDSEYQYFLDKHSGSVRRASMDAARAIMFKLSMRSDEQVDIFSIKGSKAAENYRLALLAYIRSPDLNPVFVNAMPYAGGISKSDMIANDAVADNNIIVTPVSEVDLPSSSFNL
jgi:hypothetical protein